MISSIRQDTRGHMGALIDFLVDVLGFCFFDIIDLIVAIFRSSRRDNIQLGGSDKYLGD
jgi:hypothetical protein